MTSVICIRMIFKNTPHLSLIVSQNIFGVNDCIKKYTVKKLSFYGE